MPLPWAFLDIRQDTEKIRRIAASRRRQVKGFPERHLPGWISVRLCSCFRARTRDQSNESKTRPYTCRNTRALRVATRSGDAGVLRGPPGDLDRGRDLQGDERSVGAHRAQRDPRLHRPRARDPGHVGGLRCLPLDASRPRARRRVHAHLADFWRLRGCLRGGLDEDHFLHRRPGLPGNRLRRVRDRAFRRPVPFRSAHAPRSLEPRLLLSRARLWSSVVRSHPGRDVHAPRRLARRAGRSRSLCHPSRELPAVLQARPRRFRGRSPSALLRLCRVRIARADGGRSERQHAQAPARLPARHRRRHDHLFS